MSCQGIQRFSQLLGTGGVGATPPRRGFTPAPRIQTARKVLYVKKFGWLGDINSLAFLLFGRLLSQLLSQLRCCCEACAPQELRSTNPCGVHYTPSALLSDGDGKMSD